MYLSIVWLFKYIISSVYCLPSDNFSIAMENDPFLDGYILNKHCDFHSYVSHYQRVNHRGFTIRAVSASAELLL